MKLLHKFAIGLGLLLADVLLLCCCLYLTVIADKMQAVQPDYMLWLGLAVIAFLVNLILAKKSFSLGHLLAWNLIWMVFTTLVIAFTFDTVPNSIPFKVFVCGAMIAIESHSIALTVLPQKASAHLTFFDILAVVFAVFLAGCHLKDLQDVLALQVFGFICIGYTLVSLIILRTYEEDISIVKGASLSSRIKVFGLLGGIIALCCITSGILTIIAKNVGASLIDIVRLLFQSAKEGLGALGRFLTRIFSKIPQSQLGDAAVTGNYAGDPAAEETGMEAAMRLPEWFLPVLGIIIVGIVAILLLRLIYLLRKASIDTPSSPTRLKAESITFHKIKQPSFLQRLLARWKLRIKMYRYRQTPEGLAILIRKSGQRLGIAMNPSESWHGYLKRLAPYGDTSVLQEFSAYMEQVFYSGQKQPLAKETYQRYASCLKQLKKDE